jgi:hypothetical protein
MKAILLIILFLIPIRAIAPVDKGIVIIDRGGIDLIEMLWRAVCIVESNNDPLAVNVKEQAYGIAQIRECRIQHFNKLTSKSYRLEDCFNPAVSREIFMYFATEDLEKTARAWNGSGKATLKYWNKIKKYL